MPDKKIKPKVKKEPRNKVLYNKIKNEAKKKFKVFPSRYSTIWLVSEYKKQGGTYIYKKDKPKEDKKEKKPKSTSSAKKPKAKSKTFNRSNCGCF